MTHLFKVCKLFIFIFILQSFSSVAFAEKGTHVVTRVSKKSALYVFSEPDLKSGNIGTVVLGDTVKVREEVQVGLFKWVKLDFDGKTGYLRSKCVREIGKEYRPGFEKLGYYLIIILTILSIALVITRYYLPDRGSCLFINAGLFISISMVALLLGYLSLEDFQVDANFKFEKIEKWYVVTLLGIIGFAAFLGLVFHFFMSFVDILDKIESRTSSFRFAFGFGVVTSMLTAIVGLILYHICYYKYLHYVFIFYGVTQLIQTIIILYRTAPRYSYGIVASLMLMLGPMSLMIFLAPLIFRLLIVVLVLAVLAFLASGAKNTRLVFSNSSKSEKWKTSGEIDHETGYSPSRGESGQSCGNCAYFNGGICTYYKRGVNSGGMCSSWS